MTAKESGEPAKPKANKTDDGEGVSALARGLLGFLDRNLARFSPRVQDTIGIGILLLLIVFVLNGFVAPTFIRGTLYVREAADAGKTQVPGYTLVTRNEDATTNLWGNWMLPVYKAGLPGRIKIGVFGPDKKYIDQTTFYGPWPIWSAISPLEYDLEVRTFEPDGKRIRVVQRSGDEGLVSRVARYLEWPSSAHAQMQNRPPIAPMPPPQMPSPSRPIDPNLSPPSPSRPTNPDLIPRLPSPNVAPAPPRTSTPDRPAFVPVFALQVNSIMVARFPGWFGGRSSSRVYFTITLNGKELDENDLLSDPDLTRTVALAVWFPSYGGSSSGTSPRVLRFPVRSIRQSWVSLRTHEPEHFEGLIANITQTVEFQDKRSGTLSYSVKPLGQVVVHLWADNESIIASFDVSKALAAPNTVHRLSTPDDGARSEVLPMAGWITEPRKGF
jgi:hypothetical protein